MRWLINKFNNNNAIVYIILIGFYALSGLTTTPLFNGADGHDSVVFRYIGMLLNNNAVPYVDAFDHKPPIIYLLNYLGHLFNIGPWGITIVLNILGFTSVLFLFKAGIKYLEKSYVLLLALFYIAFLKYDFLIDGGGYTREVTTYLVVVILSINYLLKANKLLFFMSGVLVTLVFYTQQNEALAVIPFVLYVTLNKNGIGQFKLVSWQKIMIRFGFLTIGSMFVHAIILLLVASWGAMDEFINQAFLFNTSSYIHKRGLFLKAYELVGFLFKWNKDFFPLTLSIGFILLFCITRKIKGNSIFWVMLVCIIVQWFSTAISGKHFAHYFLCFIPYIVFTLFLMLKNLGEASFFKKLPIAPLVLSLLVFATLRVSYLKISYFKDGEAYGHNEEIFSELKKVEGQRGQLYSFDLEQLSYLSDLNIVAPSKWAYTHFFKNPSYDTKVDRFEGILKSINTHETAYLIVNDSMYYPEIIEEKLKEFLKENYQEIAKSPKENVLLFSRIKE